MKNKKNVLIIGYGGMGRRYYKSLKNLGFRNIDIYDKKPSEELIKKKKILFLILNILKKNMT